MSEAPNTSRVRTPARPYLKPWYRVAEDGDRLVFEYAHTAVVFEGKAALKLLPVLLPLLDGSRTVEQIAAPFGEGARDAIENAVELLAARGLLTEGPPPDGRAGSRDTVAFLAASSNGEQRPAAVAERLRAARVGIAGGSAYVDETARLLRRSGVEHVERVYWSGEHADEVDLVLVLPSPDEVSELAKWNRTMLERRSAWLQVLPYDGCFAAVGPLYLPGATCCHACYLLRRASTLGYRSEYRALEPVALPFASAPPVESTAVAIAVTLAIRWVALDDALVPGRLFAFEPGPVYALTTHHVYRVPRCSECSRLEGVAAPLPWFKESDVVRG